MKVMTLDGLGMFTPPDIYTPTTEMPTKELARLRGVGAVGPLANATAPNLVGAIAGAGLAMLFLKKMPIQVWLPVVGAALVGGFIIGGKVGARL